MPEHESFLNEWEKEFKTTVKVLKAFPENKQDMKPSDKSKSALELAWLFASEEEVFIRGIMTGKIDFSKMRKAPDTIKKAIEEFEKNHVETVEQFKKLTMEDLNQKMQFYSAPKKMGEFRRMDLLWMMLHDHIHHRGQFSVYLRIVGAKVPSIYGPTADEPWN